MTDRNKFRARLYAALASPQLALLADSEPLVIMAKTCDLMSQLAMERHRLGLYTGKEDGQHYASDIVVSVS